MNKQGKNSEKCIKIGSKKIGVGQPVFIIAEAGVNHNGSLKLAKKMIDAAKLAGADAIKFQTFKTEDLVTKTAPMAVYQKRGSNEKSQFEMLKRLELSEKEFKELYSYCREKDIIFLSTPFDIRSAEFLYRLGIPSFKIGSGDLTNIPLLIQVAKYNRPLILSTGMSVLREVKEAVQAIYSTGNKKLILLHCTSSYPTRYEDVNLTAMATLRKKFNVIVGYSDHSEGVEASIAAVAMGASVIERHFTLDKNLIGPDHRASLEPNEFKKMLLAIRNIEKAMGDGIKKPTQSENEIKNIARKSIVAATDIPKGTRITRHMLIIKRPGTGIKPNFLNRLINRKARLNLKKDQVLTWEHVS